MKSCAQLLGRLSVAALTIGLVALAGPAFAIQPEVKTVPAVPTNPLIPHDAFTGETTTLKGTSSVQDSESPGCIDYSWDFGDGSAPANGTVSNKYVVEATHAYAGAAGTLYTARLTVEDTCTGESDNEIYLVRISDKTLEFEVNAAIDEGLWYLHKTMRRYDSGAQPFGDWLSGGNASSSYEGNTAANLNAFFVQGNREAGSANNPYTEDVQRGMRYLFTRVRTIAIGNQTYPAPINTVNPDSNGNGYGVESVGSYPPYQLGQLIGAIVAGAEPTRVTTTGQTPSGVNPGILGRTYKDIVQDMADAIAWGQGDAGFYYGGWTYGWQSGVNARTDNSINQWNAIGLVEAERSSGFNVIVPQFIKDANLNSISTTQTTSGATAGQFGYASTSPIWGPYAVTPSGAVQMAMDGIGRGDPRWDRTETYLRDQFCNTGSAFYAVRSYYYGLFSLTKSMLLHDTNGDGISEPLDFLTTQPGDGDPIDWYAAETASGADCNGVARTLVDDQNSAGYWYGHYYSSAQGSFETAQAVIMLSRTVVETNVVAVAEAIPNPGVVGQNITLDGSASFTPDPDRVVDSWEWDLDNDGQYDDASGPIVNTSFPAVADYPIGLRVTDDDSPENVDTTVVVVRITTPPVAPTADADGPYVFCPQTQPWFLDGTGSVNPDEGESEAGQPGDTIQEYAWELDGDNDFNDAFGAQPDVTAFFQTLGVGGYTVQLRVTDTTATSFPSSGMPDLTGLDTSGQAFVKNANDPACSCVDDLAARPKSGKVQLTWTDTGASSYNVYRGTTMGGPYVLLANTTSTYSTYLDTNVANGTTYYYVVREVATNSNELCQSNEVSATPQARGGR